MSLRLRARVEDTPQSANLANFLERGPGDGSTKGERIQGGSPQRLRDARDRLPASSAWWRGLPPRNRPNCHVLPPALPAAAYLGIPTRPEFVRLHVRGILRAIPAEAEGPLRSVEQKNLAPPSEGRQRRRPVAECRKDTLPEVETNSSLAVKGR